MALQGQRTTSGPNGKNGASELQTLQKTVISDRHRGGFVFVGFFFPFQYLSGHFLLKSKSSDTINQPINPV